MFDVLDLFAGIGGFHEAMTRVGGRVVQAAELDPKPAAVYHANWGLKPDADVRDLARDPGQVREVAVVTGGFPCQPFSKSGRQLGIAEERGTLFHDVLTILEAQAEPAPVVMLENVRNLAGPRQSEAWAAVTNGLRDAGYRVASKPCTFSPHLLNPALGGAPQVRERLYILGVYVGRARAVRETDVPPFLTLDSGSGWNPENWSIRDHVILPEPSATERRKYVVADDEEVWINTWNELLGRLGQHARLPGHPLWQQFWTARVPPLEGMPPWKQSFIVNNHDFYIRHRRPIDAWMRSTSNRVESFPQSRRKLEWQAQQGKRDLWEHLIQMRPSGIRVKRATYAPALVAMNQTPIFGPLHRRLTPEEAARLQGLDPKTFSFGSQASSLSYKQLGNAVNAGTAAFVFEQFVRANASDIRQCGPKGRAVVDSVAPNLRPVDSEAAA